MNPELLRRSLKLAIAAFVTAAIAVHFDRIAFAWYPLLAVVMVVDDDDEQTIAAARGRILGTITGGLVTFLVHTILSGWIGVLVSMLLMIPVLRLLGWQSALSTATLISVMFLMIPGHAALNWDYVFNRAIDTGIGCAVALLVGLLLWPRDRLQLLRRSEAQLQGRISAQLMAQNAWLMGQGPRPDPLPPASFSAGIDQMQRWLELEQRGPHRSLLKRQRWRQRLLLWARIQVHWHQWERLLAGVDPSQALATSLSPLIALLQPGARPLALASSAGEVVVPWQQAATGTGRPMAYLAAAAELQPLLAGFISLALLPPLPREPR